MHPDQFAGRAVERDHRPPGAGGRIDDAVDRERRAFELELGARAEIVGLEPPRHFEVVEVLGGDLRERRVARAARVAGVTRPVAVLRRCQERSLRRRGRPRRRFLVVAWVWPTTRYPTSSSRTRKKTDAAREAVRDIAFSNGRVERPGLQKGALVYRRVFLLAPDRDRRQPDERGGQDRRDQPAHAEGDHEQVRRRPARTGAGVPSDPPSSATRCARPGPTG